MALRCDARPDSGSGLPGFCLRTTQGSCAHDHVHSPERRLVSELPTEETRSDNFHTPLSQRFNGQSSRVCRRLSRRLPSALEQRALSSSSILRYFPSFVCFAFKHVSGLFLWYTVCLFPVPRDSSFISNGGI